MNGCEHVAACEADVCKMLSHISPVHSGTLSDTFSRHSYVAWRGQALRACDDGFGHTLSGWAGTQPIDHFKGGTVCVTLSTECDIVQQDAA